MAPSEPLHRPPLADDAPALQPVPVSSSSASPASAQPSIFVSHGSPMIALEPGRTGAFLRELGPALIARHGRPRAVLAVSAHTAWPGGPRGQGLDGVLLGAPRQHTVHDFGGFDPRLNRIVYEPPGEPELSSALAQDLAGSGWRIHHAPEGGGLDHGIWTALMHLLPQADVPVLPLAWPRDAAPDRLMALGRALAPWRERGVMVLATGSITHNLQRVFTGGGAGRGAPADDTPEIPESQSFRQWWAERAEAGDWPALTDWRRQAPHAADMHPTDEHLLPWFVAAGAGVPPPAGPTRPTMQEAGLPRRIHAGVTFGCLGMDAYRFD